MDFMPGVACPVAVNPNLDGLTEGSPTGTGTVLGQSAAGRG